VSGDGIVDELGDGKHEEVAAFSTVIFHCGGTGARPGKDGLDVTAFPSGVRTIPVEATESVAPVMISGAMGTPYVAVIVFAK